METAQSSHAGQNGDASGSTSGSPGGVMFAPVLEVVMAGCKMLLECLCVGAFGDNTNCMLYGRLCELR